MGVWPMLLVLVLTAASTTSSTTASPTTSPAGEEQILLTEMRAAIVVNQLLLQQLQAALPQPEPSCPFPYTRVLDECFFVSKKSLSWDYARQHCRGMAGDLATPKHLYALHSYIFISEGPFASPSFLDVWVGGRRREYSNWLWLDNRTISSLDWLETLPGGRSSSNACVYIHNRATRNDPPLANMVCSTQYRFVCQLRS